MGFHSVLVCAFHTTSTNMAEAKDTGTKQGFQVSKRSILPSVREFQESSPPNILLLKFSSIQESRKNHIVSAHISTI